MPRHPSRIALVLVAAASTLAGCDRPSPQELAEERAARQDACVAEELASAARNKRDDLETMLRNAEAAAQSSGGADPLGGMMRAPLAFAQAYAEFAARHRSAFALLDSAAVATERADSARLVERARALQGLRPAAGSVQANVAAQYGRELQAARENPHHPCMTAPQEER